MGFRTEVEPLDIVATQSMAAKLFNENVAITKQLTAQLPKNRDLLRKVRDHGMQPI
jgi:tryptophan halogenase